MQDFNISEESLAEVIGGNIFIIKEDNGLFFGNSEMVIWEKDTQRMVQEVDSGGEMRFLFDYDVTELGMDKKIESDIVLPLIRLWKKEPYQRRFPVNYMDDPQNEPFKPTGYKYPLMHCTEIANGDFVKTAYLDFALSFANEWTITSQKIETDVFEKEHEGIYVFRGESDKHSFIILRHMEEFMHEKSIQFRYGADLVAN